jgi:hypothetical protein
VSAVAVVRRASGLERSGGQEGDRTHLRVGIGPEDANAQREPRVIRILYELGMPPEDIRALVAAGDPVVVHRYIELHGGRLAERLAHRLQTLVRLEKTLNNAILEHGPPASRRPPQLEMTSCRHTRLELVRRATPHVAASTRRVRWARSGRERVTQEVSDGPQ